MSTVQQKGFTLIEVIIYLALFSILMSGFLVASFSLVESAGKDTSRSLLQAEGEYLLAKILYALKEEGKKIDPTALVSTNMRISDVSFTTISDGVDTDIGVHFILSMQSQEGRVLSEDFFSTTTLMQ